jgi:hypothetical protein
MTPNRGRIPAVAGVDGHRLGKGRGGRFPDAGLAPSSEALMDRHPLTVPAGAHPEIRHRTGSHQHRPRSGASRAPACSRRDDVRNVRNGGRSIAAVLVRQQGRSAGSRYRSGMRSAWPRNSARFRNRTHCRRLCLGLDGLVRAFLRGFTAADSQSRLTALPTTDPSSEIRPFLTGLAIAADFLGLLLPR